MVRIFDRNMKQAATNTSIATRFEALRPRLKMWATRLLGSDEDADDALQDAFFRLWRHKDNMPATVEAMSMTALRSACIDSLRRRKIRMAEPIEEAERQSSSPAESMADMAEDIKELIESRLDERSKEILLLPDSLDYDYDEIAQRLGITESHARVILSRARKTIRNAYRELR